MLDEAHWSEEICTEETSETDPLAEEPFREAVTVAVWGDETVPAVAVKCALLLPAGMAMEEGTARVALLDFSVTVTPPVPAEPFRFTVQVDVAEELRDAGEHEIELTVTALAALTVIVPPVELTESTLPAGEAPIAFAIPICALVAPPVKVAVTTATTPLEMMLALTPETKQI
jgi:hypothetical protein